MLEQMLQRQRRVLLLAALAGLAVLVFGYTVAGLVDPANFGPGLLLVAAFLGAGMLVFAFAWQHYRSWLFPLERRVRGGAWQIVRWIDAEIAADTDVAQFGDLRSASPWAGPRFIALTPSWLARVGRNGIQTVVLDDVPWVFLRRCRYVRWGLRHHALGLRVYCRGDRWEFIPLDDAAEMDAAVEEMARRRPEIAVLYYDDLVQLLAQGPTSFAERAVRERGAWRTAPAEQREAHGDDMLSRLHSEVQLLPRFAEDPFASFARTPRPPYGPGRKWSPEAGLAPRVRPQLSQTLRAERRRPFVWSLISLAAGGYCIPIVVYHGVMDLFGWDPFRGLPAAEWCRFGAALAFFAIWTWVIYRFVYRSFRHDLWRRLAELGEPAEVIDRVDAELRGDNVWVTGTPFYADGVRRPDFIAVTASWLMHARPGQAVLVRVPDVVWAYKRRKPGPAWLPWSSRRYDVGCRTRDGAVWYIESRHEIDIDLLFQELLERRPALLAGWGGECLDLLERGPAALAAAHDARAAEFEGLAAEKREAWLDESWQRYRELVWNVEQPE